MRGLIRGGCKGVGGRVGGGGGGVRGRVGVSTLFIFSCLGLLLFWCVCFWRGGGFQSRMLMAHRMLEQKG